MTTSINIANRIAIAKAETARAKTVKAWRLRKDDKILQAIDMPKGYMLATDDEIAAIYAKLGVKCDFTPAPGVRRVWCLCASRPSYANNGRMFIKFAAI